MTKITKAIAMREVKRLVKEHPDTRNPTNVNGACLYFKGRGNTTRRCIAGQMGWNLGLPTPKADEGMVDQVAGPGGTWAGLLTVSAVDYLVEVQDAADGTRINQGRPLSWGEIPKDVLNGRS